MWIFVFSYSLPICSSVDSSYPGLAQARRKQLSRVFAVHELKNDCCFGLLYGMTSRSGRRDLSPPKGNKRLLYHYNVISSTQIVIFKCRRYRPSQLPFLYFIWIIKIYFKELIRLVSSCLIHNLVNFIWHWVPIKSIDLNMIFYLE